MSPHKVSRDLGKTAFFSISVALASALVLAIPVAQADISTKDSEFHVRLGMVNGTFNSPNTALLTSNFSVSNSVDVEYEHFSSSHGSYLIRSLFSFDTALSTVRYMYTGVGKRWYFWGSGMQFDTSDGGEAYVTAVKRRYYFTAEGGLSTVVGEVHTNGILQSLSADYEFGANVGVIQQMGSSWGIEAQAGYTQAFGFSSVSLSGSTIRLLLGVAVYF